MTESDIQASICDYLALKKRMFWRSNNTPVYDPVRKVHRAMPKYARKGVPDIIVVKDGFIICLEVKTEKGRQSKDQKQFEADIKEAGAEYWVVRSIDDVAELGL